MWLTSYKEIFLNLERNPVWTNTYGLARSLLGMGTLLTLIINNTEILFKRTNLSENYCDSFGISLYCVFDNLLIGRLISIGILILVVIGWRPRVTAILHCWVMYSLINSATILDGGDHIALIVSVLLFPIALTDDRKWHWSSFHQQEPLNTLYVVRSLIARSCILVIKIQVGIIYLNAASAKLSVKEWVDGTAIYYWFNHPLFGYPKALSPIIEPLLLNGTSLFIITWGIIIFEFLLFAGLLMDERFKKYFLTLGILFHFGILAIHGLASFFFTMTTCLILYLRPTHKTFTLPKFIVKLKKQIYATFCNTGSVTANSRRIV